LISVFALLFTVGSFWWIQSRRGRLHGYAPRGYGADFHTPILVVLPLVLHNPAPAPLIVTDARLRLRSPDQGIQDSLLRWSGLRSAIVSSAERGGDKYPSPFSVAGRKTVEKFLQFRGEKRLAFETGPFEATIELIVEPRRWRKQPQWSPLLTFTLHTELVKRHELEFDYRSNDPE
jgi:hypothetical protein